MKKVAVLFLFLMLFSLASAAEIRLSKEVYQPAETLQAEVYGNFLDPIKPENIHFYRERNIPVEYDVLQLSGRYLVYALLPYKEGNYTITIEDIEREEEHVVTDKEIVKEFKIQKGNESYLTINPGFVVARDDFYIIVESKNNMQLEVSFLGEEQTIDLIGEKEKKIYFSIANVTNYTETNISLLSYSIPVIIFPNESSFIKETPQFRFNPLEIETAILKGGQFSFVVALVNFGLKNITDITLSSNSSLSIQLSQESIPLLEAREKQFINLTVSSEKTGNFTGKITASSSNFTTELDLKIMVTENRSEINDFINKSNGSSGYVGEKSCAEQKGKQCLNKEECSIPEVTSTDGSCCLGECVEPPDGGGSWIYGVILIVVLIGGVIGFLVYMKKKQGHVTDFLKKREQNFQERMTPPPAPPSQEVRGTLSKT